MARIKLKLKRIDPVKAGIVYGALTALLSLIFILPFMLLFSAAGFANQPGMGSMFGGGLTMLFLPIVYGIIGFIGGLIGTALLNFILSKTNGLDIEFDGKDMEISHIGEENLTI
ncbi:MAG TPA: hypothetical protein ENK67_08120 [Flavobacteriia bacterium]|jgi:hypothetical protein|nr:hypothetical protein [Flavobacteriia bacterium]